MKNLNAGVDRLLYDAPELEIMGTVEGVLCLSGGTQEFEDGGSADGWFN